MMFLSGVFFPREQLPELIRVLSEWLPLTAAVELVRPMFMDRWPAQPLKHLLVLGLRGGRILDCTVADAAALRRLERARMAALLPPDLVAIMARGVSVIVASRDAALRPQLRAVGSRVEADGRDITVYLSRPQSRQLVQDLAATGHVAVVFSVPSTHRSVQLKASRVEMRNADADDAPVLARYLASMEHEVQQVGFAPPLTRAMLAHRLETWWRSASRPSRPSTRRPGRAPARPSGARGERPHAAGHPLLLRGHHPRHGRHLQRRGRAQRRLHLAGVLCGRAPRRPVLPVLQQDAAEHPGQSVRDGTGARPRHGAVLPTVHPLPAHGDLRAAVRACVRSWPALPRTAACRTCSSCSAPTSTRWSGSRRWRASPCRRRQRARACWARCAARASGWRAAPAWMRL